MTFVPHRNLALLMGALAGSLLLSACDKADSAPPESPAKAPQETNVTASPPRVLSLSAGKRFYDNYCLTCHQADGGGVPGMHPPLIDSEIVLSGNPRELIRVTLLGSEALPESDYMMEMTGLDSLSDEQIAAILTYIRTDLATVDNPEVSPNQVKDVRSDITP